MIANDTKQAVCDALNKDIHEYIGRMLNDADMYELVTRHRKLVAEMLNIPVESVTWNPKGSYKVAVDGETVDFNLKRQQC